MSHETFRTLREQIGTQQEVADLLERSIQWIGHIEQGRRPPPRYAIFALKYLLTREGQKELKAWRGEHSKEKGR